MRVTIRKRNHEEVFVDDAVHAIGATPAYPYWVVWREVDQEGNQEVIFFDKEIVSSVSMYGPPEEDGPAGKKSDHLKVVPFDRVKGGDTDGTISQD